MKIELIFLRQFYPKNGDIIKTPNGTATTKESWLPYDSQVEIERLLNEIKNKHGIDYKIELVSNEYIKQEYKDKYPIKTHHEIYFEIERFSKTLVARGKRYWKESFHNTSGNASVGNSLILKIDDKIEWYEATPFGIFFFLRSTLDEGVNFIKNRLKQQENYTSKIENAGGTEKESELINKLLRSGLLGSGRPEGEFPIGSKRLDLLFSKETEDWIVEAKEGLNWEAIGQVVGYSILYDELINKNLLFKPKKELRKGIVYSIPDRELEFCCGKLEIKLFREDVL